MTSLNPFIATGASSTVGGTTKVTANNTPTSVSGTISAIISGLSSTIVATNSGTVLVFVRVSAEATPTATAADYPLLPGSQVVLSNPNPGALIGLAVLSSTTVACDIFFTPGQGE